MSVGVSDFLDQSAIGRRDPGGMVALIGRTPRMIEQGWRLSRDLQLSDVHRSAKSVAVLGMGGSAIAGDLVRGIFSDRLRVPLVSVRDYELPAWVGSDTLVVAVSHSGATEETISAFSAALGRRCPAAVITAGGPLGDVATRVGLPALVYPDESPPRAALGYTLPLVAGLLERAGMLALDDEEAQQAAAGSASVIAANGPDVATDNNTAKQLAWALVSRLPIIEASGFLAPVARRWKTQLNENAKSGAMFEELPEATHNAVVGYEQPETVRDNLYVVFLASPLDQPRNARRAAISTQLLAAAGIAYQVVPVSGEGRLGQACAAITLGDYVSAYLALLYGLDPTPVEAIGLVKRSLATDEEGEED